MIVLDASLMIEWLVGNTSRSDLPHLHNLLIDVDVMVPSHWPVEISNFLCTGLVSKEISLDQVQSIMERLDKLQILIDPPFEIDEIGPLAIFASEYGLTSYDAAYVQLAFHRKAILATLDMAMRKVAQRLDIALLPVQK